METNKDYYEILGVDKDADAKTIKRAFLKKAQKLHPDINKAPDAEERFKEVNEAYSVLSDDEKRSNYDRFGDPNGPAGFGGYSADFSDLGSIFSDFFGGFGGSEASVRTAGRDMGTSVTITLEEAAAGCSKTVSYSRLAPCDDCGGTGAAEGGKSTTCPTCHGARYVTSVQRTLFGVSQVQSACPECNGTGVVIDKPCETCDGQGRTPSREKVEVKIPAGIRSGQSVRCANMGEAGIRADKSGDLLVRIDIAAHERFERQGDDLYSVEDISALEAMCGCKFEVPGILEGETITIDVPAGTQHATHIEVEDKGMPRRGSNRRGKFIVVINVVVPEDLSKEELKQLRKIAKAHKARINGATSK